MRRDFCSSRVSQVCTVTVSTGACFWYLRILAPPAACAGSHGTSGVQGPWRSQCRSGEWPEWAGHPWDSQGQRQRGAEPGARSLDGVQVGPLQPGETCRSACTVTAPRVSLPLSVLDPPHQHRIHRRKSFDASDTLALPRVRMGLGLPPVWPRSSDVS